jgi:hypothetical protein
MVIKSLFLLYKQEIKAPASLDEVVNVEMVSHHVEGKNR